MTFKHGQHLDGVLVDPVHDAVISKQHCSNFFSVFFGDPTSYTRHFRRISCSLAEAFDPFTRCPRVIAGNVLANGEKISSSPIGPKKLH
jgi:hypothetical protein